MFFTYIMKFDITVVCTPKLSVIDRVLLKRIISFYDTLYKQGDNLFNCIGVECAAV